MMSKKNIRKFFKYFVFTILFFAVCAFQTSFWSELITFVPAPQFWLIFLVYIFLKWPGFQTIFYTYFLGYILMLFTLMPLEMSWFTLLGLYAFVWLFKNRIHSSSLFLFSVLCAASSLYYSGIYILCSTILESKITSFLIFHRVLEAGMTFLASGIIYLLLDLFDRFFATDESWSPATPNLNSHLDDI
jgi:hypothetical protein